MRDARFLGPALFVSGVALLAVGFLRGEASLSLVLVVPLITATGWTAGLGILLMVLAFVASFVTWPVKSHEPSPPTERGPAAPAAPRSSRWGGVVFLGPIPVVFGSDAGVSRAMLALGVALFLGLLVLTVLLLLAI